MTVCLWTSLKKKHKRKSLQFTNNRNFQNHLTNVHFNTSYWGVLSVIFPIALRKLLWQTQSPYIRQNSIAQNKIYVCTFFAYAQGPLDGTISPYHTLFTARENRIPEYWSNMGNKCASAGWVFSKHWVQAQSAKQVKIKCNHTYTQSEQGVSWKRVAKAAQHAGSHLH